MNLVNASTGFSNFQIQLSRSPQIIPPLVPHTVSPAASTADETLCTQNLITQLQMDIDKTKDNLLQAKIFQTHYANQNTSPEIPFKIGNHVMLSTLHCHQEFKKKGKKRAAKFFPCHDGPYNIIDKHTATSNYTLELPNSPQYLSNVPCIQT